MLKRCRMLVLALLMVAVASPVAAVKTVERLPEVRPATSMRFEMALVLNNLPFIVGKGEMASPTRAHFVLKVLAVGNLPESTIEIVVYDGTVYSRVDEETQFVIENQNLPVGAPDEEVIGGDVTLGAISQFEEAVTIAGVRTIQYQIPLTFKNEPTIESAKVDLFVGEQLNYLYQDQLTLSGTDPDLGKITLEEVMRFYDFDNPNIVVNRPTNVAATPARASGFFAPLRHGSVVGTLSAPLSSAKVRSLAVKRSARYAR